MTIRYPASFERKLAKNPTIRAAIDASISVVREREIRGKPAGVRLEIRHTRARSVIDKLHHWFNKTLAGLSRKSDTAVAIR
jgi:hypothetical protein